MRKARLRALTQMLQIASKISSVIVEMRKARLRALTHPTHTFLQHRNKRRRNEESPIEGIDTCHEQTHGSGSSL